MWLQNERVSRGGKSEKERKKVRRKNTIKVVVYDRE